MTEEELLSQLRLQGIERLEDVKYAFMEMDGRISVIPKQDECKGESGRGNERKAV